MCAFNKLLIVFLIVQNTLSKPYRSTRMDIFHFPSIEIPNEETTPPAPKYSTKRCPDKDHSLISYSDIKYQIEDMTQKLLLDETLISSSYPKATEIREKYLEELKEVREELEDRPIHMLHILDEMAKIRQNMEPKVEEIAEKLREFDIHEEKYNAIAERADTSLKQLEKYKKICQINCGDYDIETRFGKKYMKNPFHIHLKHTVNNDMTCVRLKDLNEYLTAKLSHFQQEFGQALLNDLDYRDEGYAQKLRELKISLKKTAVNQFGMTMYDILSLQDDYGHFEQDLNNLNISAELDKIEENSAAIKLRLIGLKRDMEKLRQKCINCYNDHRVKRNIHFIDDDDDIYFSIESDESFQTEHDSETDIIQELINAKTNAIKQIINGNFTAKFEELDKDFNDPNFIDSYISRLKPIQTDIEYEIKSEQDAFDSLRNIIPESSLERILAVSDESEKIIQRLESARQYIDRFLN